MKKYFFFEKKNNMLPTQLSKQTTTNTVTAVESTHSRKISGDSNILEGFKLLAGR